VRVISFNVNGLRAAYRKGLEGFLQAQAPDVLCLQELKADEASLPPLGYRYHASWHCADKKGYSGVAILSKDAPQRVVSGLGRPEFDCEGRVLRADFKDFSVLNVYVPSGSSGEARQAYKMHFLAAFFEHVAGLLGDGLELVICGDFNIAHRKIDLKNWQANQRSSGFLPEERAWLDSFLALGLHDGYRELVGHDTPAYSWWSLRTAARARDVGWRLDYQFVTPGLRSRARRGAIPKAPVLSDHAPVIIDYDPTGLGYDVLPRAALE
jgi:exodeoxyribonuclease III